MRAQKARFLKKTIFIYLFPLLYVFATVKPYLPIFNYIANYTYYKTVLCENKEIKEMKCNGKCQLMKEMQLQNAPSKSVDDLIVPPIDFSKYPVTTTNVVMDSILFTCCRYKNTIYKYNYNQWENIPSHVLIPPPNSIA